MKLLVKKMDWVLILKILAVLAAAILGVFGVLYEYRDGGMLTLGGRITIGAILSSSILAGVLEAAKAMEERARVEQTLEGIDRTLKPLGEDEDVQLSLYASWTAKEFSPLDKLVPSFRSIMSRLTCKDQGRIDKVSGTKALCFNSKDETERLIGLLFCPYDTSVARFPFENDAKYIRVHIWIIKDFNIEQIRNAIKKKNIDFLKNCVSNVRRIGHYMRFRIKEVGECRDLAFSYYAAENKLELHAEMILEVQSNDGSFRSYRDLENCVLVMKFETWSEPGSDERRAIQKEVLAATKLSLLELQVAEGVKVPLSAFSRIRLPDTLRKNSSFLSQIHLFALPAEENELLGIGAARGKSYSIPAIYGERVYIQ